MKQPKKRGEGRYLHEWEVPPQGLGRVCEVIRLSRHEVLVC